MSLVYQIIIKTELELKCRYKKLVVDLMLVDTVNEKSTHYVVDAIK